MENMVSNMMENMVSNMKKNKAEFLPYNLKKSSTWIQGKSIRKRLGS